MMMTYQNKYQNVNNQDFSVAPGDDDNIDEIGRQDLKINPDFYIHLGIIEAQKLLTKDNMKEGFLQYTIMVQHLESLCRSANILDDEYPIKIEEFKKTIVEPDALARNVMIANMRIELMLTAVFNKKTIRDKLSA